MRALVTGGAGFIGRHLVLELIRTGTDVVVFDRNADTNDGNDVRSVCADLQNRSALISALSGVDVVFHLAWSGIHRSSNEDPVTHAASNLVPTLALFEACVQSHVKRLVFLSSGGAVYGKALTLPISEDHPAHPLSLYGVTKPSKTWTA